MLQRVQTLYLLASVVLLGLLFFVPLASYLVQPQMERMFLGVTGLLSEGLKPERIFAPWALTVLAAVVTALPLVCVFLFKKRMLQLRLCIVNVVLLLGLQAVLTYVVIAVGKQLAAKPDWGFVFIMPVVAIILHVLATRAIAKDEALVRSLDRLR